MADVHQFDEQSTVHLSEGAAEVIAHLCAGECHAFGNVMSWCETRGDCVHQVTCPNCGSKFQLDDDDIAALERWTAANGDALVCGIRDVA